MGDEQESLKEEQVMKKASKEQVESGRKTVEARRVKSPEEEQESLKTSWRIYKTVQSVWKTIVRG
jgi:hypothetical protein